MSGTEKYIRRGMDGEVLGITYGSADIIKLGLYSMGKALGEELVTEGVFSDVMSYWNFIGRIEVYVMEESLVAEGETNYGC